MIFGDTVNDILRLNASVGGDLDITGSFVSASNASPPVGDGVDTAPFAVLGQTGSGDITICAGAANKIRRLTECSIRNVHASAAPTIIIRRTVDGANYGDVDQCVLLPGESFVYNGAIWLHKDVNGAIYPSVGNAASQADMEAGTANNKYVTPLGVNWHPGSCKCWGKAVGAGTSLTVNWNTSGIVDTGTGRLGVTIGTDFSSANYSIIAQIERGVTSLLVADVETCAIRNASPAAGTFEIESYDHTATTMAADDPQNYFWACFGDQ